MQQEEQEHRQQQAEHRQQQAYLYNSTLPRHHLDRFILSVDDVVHYTYTFSNDDAVDSYAVGN